MKFDDPWIDGYIKKLEKENELLKSGSENLIKRNKDSAVYVGELANERDNMAMHIKSLESEIELLKCENESLGHWNKKLRGEAK